MAKKVKHNTLGNMFMLVVLLAVAYIMIMHVYPKILNQYMREGMSSGRQRQRKQDDYFCEDNNCPAGCTAPKEITGTCPSAIFEDDGGKCYRKCPYSCTTSSDKCKYNTCCMGCGFKKFSVNCDGTMTPRQPTDDAGNTTPDAPSPTHLGTTKKGNTTLEDSLMIPSEDYEYTSSQSPYTRQYSCMDSITGAFTDCGPESANTGCFDKY